MGDGLAGFAVYVSGVILLLLVIGLLERFWPEESVVVDEAEPELIRYKNAS